MKTYLLDPCDGSAAALGAAGHIAIEQVAPLASAATLSSAFGRLFAFGGALDVRDPLTTAPWALRFLAAATPSRFAAGTEALGSLLSEALPAWRRLMLGVDQPDLLLERGHLLVWESEKTERRGRSSWARAPIGQVSTHMLDVATSAALARLTNGHAVAGLRFVGTAQISDLTRLAEVLKRAFIEAGGLIEATRVEGVEAMNGHAAIFRPNGQRWSADIIVIAAGAGSAHLMAGLGPRPPLIFERGYHLRWADHDWPDDMPPVVFEDRSMIVTRFERGLQLSSFVEFGGAASRPDSRKWERLARHAATLGLPVRGEPARWVGARPTLPDYLPAIGRSSAAENLIYAFGHQHLGLTLGPVTAECVASLATGEATAVPLAPFDLGRFERRRS